MRMCIEQEICDMSAKRKGMKGSGTMRADRRKAWGITRRGQLLPEMYAIGYDALDAAADGDKVVRVEIRVIHE